MVQEYRQINLDKQEMINALEAHQRMTPDFLPDGKIVDFDIIDQTSIIITVATSLSTQEISLIFPDYKLIDALIRYCLENNIMLPRQGQKSVLASEYGISLCIALDLDTYIRQGKEPVYSSFNAFVQ